MAYLDFMLIEGKVKKIQRKSHKYNTKKKEYLEETDKRNTNQSANFPLLLFC